MNKTVKSFVASIAEILDAHKVNLIDIFTNDNSKQCSEAINSFTNVNEYACLRIIKHDQNAVFGNRNFDPDFSVSVTCFDESINEPIINRFINRNIASINSGKLLLIYKRGNKLLTMGGTQNVESLSENIERINLIGIPIPDSDESVTSEDESDNGKHPSLVWTDEQIRIYDEEISIPNAPVGKLKRLIKDLFVDILGYERCCNCSSETRQHECRSKYLFNERNKQRRTE